MFRFLCLLSYPNGLTLFYSKRDLLWPFNVTGNNKIYLGLHIVSNNFSCFNQIWIFWQIQWSPQYQISGKSVQQEPHWYTCTYGQTDAMKLKGTSQIYANIPKNCMSFWMKVCWMWVQGNATHNLPYRTDQNPHAIQMAHLEFKTMIKYYPAAGSCLWQLTQLRTNKYWMYGFKVQVWSGNILMLLYLPYKGKFMKHISVTTWVIKDLQKFTRCTFVFIYITAYFISETLNFLLNNYFYSLTFMWLCIVSVFLFKYNQQDATLYNILYYSQCSTCFGQRNHPKHVEHWL